jgi:hypothetical protein
MFQRHLFVLRAIASEVPHTDEWAGKVKTVVNRVDSLEAKVDEKLSAQDEQLSALQSALQANADAQDAKLEKILTALQLLLPEDAKTSDV